MAPVKQRRRTGDLHRPHQGGSTDARPNPAGKKESSARVFSPEDTVRILECLANYTAKHGKPPCPSEFSIALKDFPKKYTGTQIYEKVRRLKQWYFTNRAAGGVGDGATEAATTQYELSSKIWADEKEPEPAKVKPKVAAEKAEAQPKVAAEPRAEPRELEEMRRLFPNLAVIVDEIASKSDSMLVCKEAFLLLDDVKAAELEAKLIAQRIKECMMINNRETLSGKVLDMLVQSGY